MAATCLSAVNSEEVRNHVRDRKVLIVDDDPLIRSSLKIFFEKEGFQAITAGSEKKALSIVQNNTPDIIFLDIKLPDNNGLSVLRTIKKIDPGVIIVVITGYANIRSSVEAIQIGAFDYLEKPLDFSQLENLVEKVRDYLNSSSSSCRMNEIIFKSRKMNEVIRVTSRLAAKSDITVLLLGESGTGKNLLCRKIHDMSPRKSQPFIEIGCSSIPENLFESELFGHEKGAFTDAKESKRGLFELANGGTVFLDEIGDMPYSLQSRLLKLLEEKSFRRVGSVDNINVDMRVCAATNKDLLQLVREKKFRLDLFYRLNVATINIPPLRERKEDILPLAEYFICHFSRKYECPVKKLSEEASRFLIDYVWPGNVRELKNVIEKVMVLIPGDVIELADIPLMYEQSEPSPFSVKEDILDTAADLSLKTMEETFIRTALRMSEGNQRKAARLLNITRDTLRYRLKKLGIRT